MKDERRESVIPPKKSNFPRGEFVVKLAPGASLGALDLDFKCSPSLLLSTDTVKKEQEERARRKKKEKEERERRKRRERRRSKKREGRKDVNQISKEPVREDDDPSRLTTKDHLRQSSDSQHLYKYPEIVQQ